MKKEKRWLEQQEGRQDKEERKKNEVRKATEGAEKAPDWTGKQEEAKKDEQQQKNQEDAAGETEEENSRKANETRRGSSMKSLQTQNLQLSKHRQLQWPREGSRQRIPRNK